MGCGIQLLIGFVIGVITWFVVTSYKRMIVLKGIDEVRKEEMMKNKEIQKVMNELKKNKGVE
jgi:hypothetical protein